jgi:hypothetical protein
MLAALGLPQARAAGGTAAGDVEGGGGRVGSSDDEIDSKAIDFVSMLIQLHQKTYRTSDTPSFSNVQQEDLTWQCSVEWKGRRFTGMYGKERQR